MIKKVAIVLALLLVVVAGVAIYMWRQATALPDWYAEADPVAEGLAPMVPPQESSPHWVAFDEDDQPITPMAAPPPEDSAPPPSIRQRRRNSPAKRHELRGFHRRALPKGQQSNPAIRASRASYQNGELEIGIILDVSKFPKSGLSPEEREHFEQVIGSFPGLSGRDVWVGVQDEPIRSDGYLQLSPHAQVRIGTLRYSLADAAQRLGMNQMELRLQINRELRRLGFSDPEA